MKFKVGSVYKLLDYPKKKDFRYVKLTELDNGGHFVVFEVFTSEPVASLGVSSMTKDVWEYYVLRGKAIRCLNAELAKLNLLGI
jgi:hypothetical protein